MFFSTMFLSKDFASQNPSMVGVGRALCGSPSPTPCPSRVTQSRLHRTAPVGVDSLCPVTGSCSAPCPRSLYFPGLCVGFPVGAVSVGPAVPGRTAGCMAVVWNTARLEELLVILEYSALQPLQRRASRSWCLCFSAEV